jgi:hypothetical protein
VNESDELVFARFARRFASIETEVQDPPPFSSARPGGALLLRPGGTAVIRLAAALAVVVAVIAVAPLIRGNPATSPTPSSAGGVVGLSTSLATSSPTPSAIASQQLDPAASPEELPGPCLTRAIAYDRMVTSIEQDAASANAVVVAKVVRIGGAQWNTQSGRPPGEDNLDALHVMRRFEVSVEEVVRGTAPLGAVLWIDGGVIGCQVFLGPSSVDVGSRYVLFLTNAAPRTTFAGYGYAWRVWPITGTLVSTEFDGELPLTTVIERAASTSP